VNFPLHAKFDTFPTLSIFLPLFPHCLAAPSKPSSVTTVMSSTMPLPVHSLPSGLSCGCPVHTPLCRMVKSSVLFAPSIICSALCCFSPLCRLATGSKHSTLLCTCRIIFPARQLAPPARMSLFTAPHPHMSTYVFLAVFDIPTSPHKLLTN
jgi:hypothetical protein